MFIAIIDFRIQIVIFYTTLATNIHPLAMFVIPEGLHYSSFTGDDGGVAPETPLLDAGPADLVAPAPLTVEPVFTNDDHRVAAVGHAEVRV